MHNLFEIFITFCAYFAIIFAIGFAAYMQTESHADYIIGNRKLGALITAMGAGASDMSAWLMIALPGTVYLIGLSKIWMPIGLIIGAYCNWKFLANRLREYTIHYSDSLTIPTYLENRFQDNSHLLRISSSLMIVVFFTIYAAANFMAGGLLLHILLGYPYKSCLLFIIVTIIIYTSIGGFLAVNWVDVFQGLLMLFTLLFLPIVVWLKLHGYNTVMHNIMQIHNNNFFNIFYNSGQYPKLLIISSIAWGLGYFGQPHILIRFMAAKNKKAIMQGRTICMSWMIASLIGAITVGVIGKIFFVNQTLVYPEMIFIELGKQLLSPWLIGILFAAVLSCIMSTVSAQLILCSSAVTEDFYHVYIRKNASQKELIFLGRFAVILISICAYIIALKDNATIMSVITHAWAGLGATFGPIILASVYSKYIHRHIAFISMLTGFIIIFTWIRLAQYYPQTPIAAINEIIPAFIGSSVIIILNICFNHYQHRQYDYE